MAEVTITTYQFDLKNKANFKVFKFPDNSVYYGEISYIDPTGAIVSNIASLPEEEKANLKRVRHGNGIQLYHNTKSAPDDFSRYEGEWELDKKHGRGKCVFADNSYYTGEFKNDWIEGSGSYIWSNGCSYVGEFSKGRMHGSGEYKD